MVMGSQMQVGYQTGDNGVPGKGGVTTLIGHHFNDIFRMHRNELLYDANAFDFFLFRFLEFWNIEVGIVNILVIKF